MTTATSTSSSLAGSTSGTPALNSTTDDWWFDPNTTTASNFTTPANSSSNWTTSSWLSSSSAYCSYVCVFNTTSAPPNTTTVRVETIVPVAYADYYIGVILAIAQTFFGGFSFLFKKVGQNRTASDERKRVAKRLAAASSRASGASTISLRNDARGDDRTGSGSAAPAGDSGGATGGATEAGDNADAAREAGAANGQSSNNFRYLLDYVWWLGMLFMAVAEIMNFVAYIFAPATVVTPLGALQIVTSAIIAWIFLKEHLNVFGQVGCVLAIIGTTLIVVFAPKEDELQTMEQLAEQCLDAVWLVYCGLVVLLNTLLIIYANPKWGRKVVFVPITVNASIGSITVMSARGIGFTYLILGIMVAALVLQIIYLNIAIGNFNINIVAPVLYVEFTSFSITASAILFKELSNLAYTNIVALLLGFLVIVVGLFLVSSFKDLKFGWRNWFRFLFRRADDAADVDAEHSTEPHTEVHSEMHSESSFGNGATHAVAANGSASAPNETLDGRVANGVATRSSADPTAPPTAAVSASGASSIDVPETDEPKRKRKKSARSRDTSVKSSLKKTWYRITDLNRFGSRRRRGVKRLVSAKLSDSVGVSEQQSPDASRAMSKSNTLESGVYENDGNAIEEEADEMARDGVFTDLDTAPPVAGEHELRTSEDLSIGELGASSASVAQLLSRSDQPPPFSLAPAAASRYNVSAQVYAYDGPSNSNQKSASIPAVPVSVPFPVPVSPPQPVLYSRRPSAAAGQQQWRLGSKAGTPLTPTPESHSNPFVPLSTSPASIPSSSAPQVAISLENIAPLPPPPVLSREPSRASSSRVVGAWLELDAFGNSNGTGNWKAGGGVERARPRPASRTSNRSGSPQPLSPTAPADASALSTSQASSDPVRLTAFKRVDFV